MSIKLDNPDRSAFLDEILKKPAPANAMRPEYHVGTYDFTEYVLEAEWGRPDDERPAQELILRVKMSIDPNEIRNEHVYVYLNVADIRITQFSGRVLSVRAGRARTEIVAVTGGYWLDKQRLPGVISYADVGPSEVIADCVKRMTRYDLAWMALEEVSGPKFPITDESTFDKRNKLSDPIGIAVSTAELFFTDSVYNAPSLTRDRSAAEATEVLHEYVVGEDIEQDDFLPEILGDEYYSVVATREANGEVEDLFEPVLIPDSVAPVDAVYEITVDEESSTAIPDAYALAVEAATRFGMGGATVSFSVKWIHPLMEDGDFISIVEPFVYGNKSGTRYWIGKVVRQRKTNELIHLFESVEMIRQSTTYDEPTKVGRLSPSVAVDTPIPGALYPSDSLYPSDTFYPAG
jgi:hypothetical protein